jgi:hypothetical protein
MGIEDQKEEREVLDSIFPEEIEGLSSDGADGENVTLTYYTRHR